MQALQVYEATRRGISRADRLQRQYLMRSETNPDWLYGYDAGPPLVAPVAVGCRLGRVLTRPNALLAARCWVS
jgi:hypothetical protein